MGRKPKNRLLNLTERETDLYGTAGFDWIPHNEQLLQAIVFTLVRRIEEISPQNPKEARWVKVALQQLTFWESFPGRSVPYEDLIPLIEKPLDLLLTKLPGRSQHIPFTLKMQRDELLGYLREKQYKEKDSKPQKEWLLKHKNKILFYLKPWLCLCEYPETIEDELVNTYFPGEHKIKFVMTKGHFYLPPIKMVENILSLLHENTSVATIREYLKPR